MSPKLIAAIYFIAIAGNTIAADIRPATSNGINLGVILEGEIDTGDYQKVRDAIRRAGPTAGTLYLRSKGGNVVEAMRIGELVRKLRMDTDAPLKLPGKSAQCFEAPPETDTNCICASACFLIYAAGSNRHGNHLGLHRPYMPSSAASSISEEQHDIMHRDISEKVKVYLHQMDVPVRFIDLMFSRSSRQVYFVSIEEAERDALMGRVPSTEEYLIAKCATLSARDETTLEALRAKSRAGALTDADRRRGQEIGTRLLRDLECNIREMRLIRSKTYERELR